MNLHTCYKGGDADGRPGYQIGFHYDGDTVEDLKSKVPHTHRSWNPEAKLWWVSDDYEETLCQMFSNFFALAHQQGTLF